MYHPIWEPAYLIEPKTGKEVKLDTVGVDRCTSEDIALFRRLDNFKRKGQSFGTGQKIAVKIKPNKLSGEQLEEWGANRNNFWVIGEFKELQNFKYVLTNVEVFNHPELKEESLTVSFFDIEQAEIVASAATRKVI